MRRRQLHHRDRRRRSPHPGRLRPPLRAPLPCRRLRAAGRHGSSVRAPPPGRGHPGRPPGLFRPRRTRPHHHLRDRLPSPDRRRAGPDVFAAPEEFAARIAPARTFGFTRRSRRSGAGDSPAAAACRTRSSSTTRGSCRGRCDSGTSSSAQDPRLDRGTWRCSAPAPRPDPRPQGGTRAAHRLRARDPRRDVGAGGHGRRGRLGSAPQPPLGSTSFSRIGAFVGRGPAETSPLIFTVRESGPLEVRAKTPRAVSSRSPSPV
jgi:hypothetical protein